MNHIEGFITAHIGDSINECDDNFAYNLSKRRFIVSDGSSTDYFSKIYAELLTDAYVEEGESVYIKDKIELMNATWRGRVKETLEKAGCRPGSFPYVRYQRHDPGCATIIGLTLTRNEKNENIFVCSGLGDSVLFFRPKTSKIPTFQFSSDSNKEFSFDQTVKFGYTPVISSSNNTEWLHDIIHVERPLEEGVFYLMTDGMAEWILRRDNGDVEDKFASLDAIHSQKDFIKYVNNIRNNGAKNDDMTLVKLYIDDIEDLSFYEEESNVYDYRKYAAEEDEKAFQKKQKELKEKEEKTEHLANEKVEEMSKEGSKSSTRSKPNLSTPQFNDILKAAVKRTAEDKAKAEEDKVKSATTATARNNILNNIVTSSKAKIAENTQKISICKKEEQARIAKNKAAYDIDVAVLESLLTMVKPLCAEFADLTTIKSLIEDTLQNVNQVYRAVEKSGEYSFDIKKHELYSSISTILTNLADTDKQEQARLSYNKMAYNIDSNIIQALKDVLESIRLVINETYPVFFDANAFISTVRELQDIKNAIEQSFRNVESTGKYDYILDGKGMSERIIQLIPLMQSAKETELLRVKSNRQKYDLDSQSINSLLERLDNFQKRYHVIVDDSKYAGIYNNITAQLGIVKQAFEAVKDAGEYSVVLQLSEIESEIQNLHNTLGFKKKMIDLWWVVKEHKRIACLLLCGLLVVMAFYIGLSIQCNTNNQQKQEQVDDIPTTNSTKTK